jgi:hypothetical protein
LVRLRVRALCLRVFWVCACAAYMRWLCMWALLASACLLLAFAVRVCVCGGCVPVLLVRVICGCVRVFFTFFDRCTRFFGLFLALWTVFLGVVD